MSAVLPIPEDIDYPDSDGQPMAENTLQFSWIVKIKGGLDAVFRHHNDVFVAGDLLWYAVRGKPAIRVAPDVMVAFGVPKGHRGSYKQWQEQGIAPQVVFEILSPGNRTQEMADKRDFYQEHGVEEYYIYDPDENLLEVYMRSKDGLLLAVEDFGREWVSPRLKIRFVMENPMEVYGPDGRVFEAYEDLAEQRDQAEAERKKAEAKRQRAEAKREKAEAERQKAEAERQKAEAEREKERQSREQLEKELQLLRAKLQQAGLDPS